MQITLPIELGCGHFQRFSPVSNECPFGCIIGELGISLGFDIARDVAPVVFASCEGNTYSALNKAIYANDAIFNSFDRALFAKWLLEGIGHEVTLDPSIEP